uniref:DUF5641 domain-containing protein n=1 Tax=Anopheles arabiensis TaxID=7173 RepID=A0A182HPH4_ANOAR
GLLRVGGRPQQTGFEYSGKHPLLLPGSSHFAKVIAVEYHCRLLHAGPRATLAEMRKEYWVIDGRRITNSDCKSCVTCFGADPKTVSHPMGQLPESRATPTRPFSVVGVDNCGPFYLKPAHPFSSVTSIVWGDGDSAGEAEINCHSLTPLSEDPTEVDALTLGLFLIGTALMTLPDNNVVVVPESHMRQFQLLQQIVQRHWKRWVTEYFKNQRILIPQPLAVGQLVISREDIVAPCEWLLARTYEDNPGSDGIVRVVILPTQQGFLKRLVSRICLLPFEKEEEY